MPPAALTPRRLPTVAARRRASSTVAPPGPKPVEVFTKSAPASSASRHPRTFSASVSSDVLEDDLHGGSGGTRLPDDRLDVRDDRIALSSLEEADCDHHVELSLRPRALPDFPMPSPKGTFLRAGSRSPCRLSKSCPAAIRKRARPRSARRKRSRNRILAFPGREFPTLRLVVSGFNAVWSMSRANWPVVNSLLTSRLPSDRTPGDPGISSSHGGFAMNYLLKTEPSEYSFADLRRERSTVWSGVSNPVAVKNLRSMKPGDRLVIYETGARKCAVGTASVVSVDDSDARAPIVKIKAGRGLENPVSLADVQIGVALREFTPRAPGAAVGRSAFESPVRLPDRRLVGDAMKLRARVVVVLAVFAAARSAGLAAEPSRMTWVVNGETREALVFAPAGTPGGKVPVILAFHGHGGNMGAAAQWMRFQVAWPEALVVYPQGLPTRTTIDPRGLKPGWQREPGQNGDRDLKLVDAILATLHQKFPVDDSRIYAAGFSNGGFFSYFLWAHRGATFAAFGVCAGLVPADRSPAEARPIIHIGGENDAIVHLSDQKETIQKVLRWNGCSSSGEPCGERCTSYPSSKGAPVVTVIHPGGHVFPVWAGERIAHVLPGAPVENPCKTLRRRSESGRHRRMDGAASIPVAGSAARAGAVPHR